MFNLVFLSRCGKIRACWNLQNNRAVNKSLKEGNLFEMQPYLITCWICRRLRVCLRWKGLWGERRSLRRKHFSPSLERRRQQEVRGRPRLPHADLPSPRRSLSLKPIIPTHYVCFADFFSPSVVMQSSVITISILGRKSGRKGQQVSGRLLPADEFAIWHLKSA